MRLRRGPYFYDGGVPAPAAAHDEAATGRRPGEGGRGGVVVLAVHMSGEGGGKGLEGAQTVGGGRGGAETVLRAEAERMEAGQGVETYGGRLFAVGGRGAGGDMGAARKGAAGKGW